MLWPRSITSRTMIAVGSLMLISYIISIVLIIAILKKPVAQSTITYLSRQIVAVYTGLNHIPDDNKLQYLSKLSQAKQIKIQSAEVPNTPPGRALHGPVTHHINRLLGTKTSFRIEKIGARHTAWIRLNNISPNKWLGVSTNPGKAKFGLNLFIQLVVIVILSGIAVLLISARLVKPIKKLAAAASVLGQGSQPEPIPEKGPREIKLLCQAFNQMTQDMHKLSEDRKQLLAGISHDLRTPLARMRLAIEMLDSKIEPELQQSIVQDMQDINNIVSQFLDYARDGSEETPEMVDITEVITSVSKSFLRRDQTFIVNIKNNLPRIKARPVSLQRLLLNLLNNAFEYGVSPVEIEVSSNQTELTLCVKDNGEGIAEPEIENILRPFSRNSDSRTNAKHAGLGLSIVQRIAKIHKADIKISNRENGGLMICVNFPLENK